jgi:hypothetical protein
VCVKPGSSTAYLCPNTFSVTLKIYVTRREYPMCGARLPFISPTKLVSLTSTTNYIWLVYVLVHVRGLRIDR